MRFRRATLVAVSVVVLCMTPPRAYAVPMPWRNCGTPHDVVTVTRADTSVWPPQVGKPITIVMQGTVSQPMHVVSAELRDSYSWPGWPPFHFVSRSNNARVSIPAGPFNVRRTLTVSSLNVSSLAQLLAFPTLPALSPSAPVFVVPGSEITIHYQAFLPSGQDVVCVDMTVPFK